jgi:hypothetical protein
LATKFLKLLFYNILLSFRVAFATGGTSLYLVLVPLLGINGGSESCPWFESQIDRGSSKIPLPVLSWLALSVPSVWLH